MNVNDIREAFSKGNTMITNNGISILYTYKDGWIDQEFVEQKKEVLLNMIRISEWVKISFLGKRMFKLTFYNRIDDQDAVIYAPLCEESSLYGLENVFDTIRFDEEISDSNDVLEFFDGCDFDDSEDVFDRIQQLMDKVDAKKPNIIKFGALKRFSEFSKAALLFVNSLGMVCEIDRPDKEFDGAVTLSLDLMTRKTVTIKGDKKELFEQLVAMFQVVMIECAVTKGYANISFN